MHCQTEHGEASPFMGCYKRKLSRHWLRKGLCEQRYYYRWYVESSLRGRGLCPLKTGEEEET